MEEDPRIADSFLLAQTRNLVIVPFFLSDGLHTMEDIPLLLGEPERIVKQRLAAGQPTWRNPTERHRKLLWYSSAVGTEPPCGGGARAGAGDGGGWRGGVRRGLGLAEGHKTLSGKSDQSDQSDGHNPAGRCSPLN